MSVCGNFLGLTVCFKCFILLSANFGILVNHILYNLFCEGRVTLINTFVSSRFMARVEFQYEAKPVDMVQRENTSKK